MTEHNTLNVKCLIRNSTNLKSGIKNNTEATLKLSSNIVGDSNDENNFQHKLLLANTQVSKLRKVFTNDASANEKLSKTHLYKIGQSGEFLGKLFCSYGMYFHFCFCFFSRHF